MRRLVLLLALVATAPHAVAQTSRRAPAPPPEYQRFLEAYRANDDARALILLDSAVQKEYTPALAMLGWYHLNGRGVPKNVPRAMQLFQQASDAGDAAGAINLAHAALHGWTGAPDTVRAMSFYKLAGERGQAEAMETYGWHLANGKGIPADTLEGIRWYERAATAGRPSAMRVLGWIYGNNFGVRSDSAKMLMWSERAADAGDWQAARNLAWSYRNGRLVERDYWAALGWYQQAADMGDSSSARDYAALRAWDGLPSDTSSEVFSQANARGVSLEAKYRLYRAAMLRGNAGAAYQVLRAFQYGLGVPKDTAAARRLARTCGAMRVSACQTILAQDFAGGFGGVKRPDLARVLNERAALQGNTLAMFLLATQYDFGQGIPRNDALATYWYRVAYSKGSVKAEGLLRSRGLLQPHPATQAFLTRIETEGPDRSNLDAFHYEVAVYCKFGGTKCHELTQEANRMLDAQNARAGAANMQRIWNLYAGPSNADADAEWRRRSQCLATNMEVINARTRGRDDWRGVRECR